MKKNELLVRLYKALKKISQGYQTPVQLRKNSEKQYGIGYEESLEMAYENLQAEAKEAIKGIRVASLTKTEPANSSKISQKQIDEWKKKAEKWDALGDKIAKYYEDDEGNIEKEGDLINIGEDAAHAFGFL